MENTKDEWKAIGKKNVSEKIKKSEGLAQELGEIRKKAEKIDGLEALKLRLEIVKVEVNVIDIMVKLIETASKL